MSDTFKIAVVGDFQRGKSTLINALLGRDEAEMGHGLSTTHENQAYALSPAVTLIDTPGFDANGNDDGTARQAVGEADVLVYVHESKMLGTTCAGLFQEAKDQAKRLVFLLNCCDFARWSPTENDSIVSTIEAELDTKDILPSVIPVVGKSVFPLNVLWARFGLGMDVAPADVNKIHAYAEEFDVPVSDMQFLRAEMLKRSGFLPVCDFLRNLPLELLKHTASNPQSEIDRIVNRFAVEFKKRWTAA